MSNAHLFTTKNPPTTKIDENLPKHCSILITSKSSFHLIGHTSRHFRISSTDSKVRTHLVEVRLLKAYNGKCPDQRMIQNITLIFFIFCKSNFLHIVFLSIVNFFVVKYFIPKSVLFHLKIYERKHIIPFTKCSYLRIENHSIKGYETRFLHLNNLVNV